MPVYLIRAGDTGPVKIGWSERSPEKRLRKFQCGHYEPLAIVRKIDGPREAEGLLHRFFKQQRIRGEWFNWIPVMATVSLEDATPPPSPPKPPRGPRTPPLRKVRKMIKAVMDNISDVIALWPSPEEFAADIDVAVSLVRVWKFRRSIPAERWAAITAAAKRRGIAQVNAEELVRLAAKEPAEPHHQE